MKNHLITRASGAPLNRIDGVQKVTGAAKYAYEYPVEDVTYVFPVQSMIAKGRVVSIDASAARALPGVLAVIWAARTPLPDVLIAGCGTGSQSILAAQRFRGVRILAVDLSLSSISYAIRKTRELGIKNIEYAQADIMKKKRKKNDPPPEPVSAPGRQWRVPFVIHRAGAAAGAAGSVAPAWSASTRS